MEQVKFLHKEYGFKSFVIGSENPFRFIKQLIKQMVKENIARGISNTSRVDWVNKNKGMLLKS